MIYAHFLPFSFFLTGIFTQWLEIKLPFCSSKDKSHMERLTESIWSLNDWSCTSLALPASRLSDKGEKIDLCFNGDRLKSSAYLCMIICKPL